MKKIKDPNIFLDHILESIVEIKKNTNNLTKNKFIKTSKCWSSTKIKGIRSEQLIWKKQGSRFKVNGQWALNY